MRWLVPGNILTQIKAADPSLAATVLNKPAVWAIGDSVLAFASYATPVARYRSFARLQADVHAKTIDPAYRWVLYDPENWDDTPAAEQADPWEALKQFGQCAHAHGYRAIMAPARDLGNVADSWLPKKPGETLEDWYLRTVVVGPAAAYGDVVDIQAQALTLDEAAYMRFVAGASKQAHAVNPFVRVLAGVSTRYGTAAQMAGAARSVHVGGYWLNCPGPDPDIGKACEFLRLMTGGT